MLNLLQTGLSGASRRQDAITNNIANADTPGYKREDVDFKSTLENMTSTRPGLELNTTHPGHLTGTGSGAHPQEFNHFRETATSLRLDGNNVDIEKEMAEMAKNNLYFDTLAQQTDAKFNTIHSVLERSGG